MAPPDEDYNYKYYLLGNTTPVRITFNAAGMKLGAEVPDSSLGKLKYDHELMSRLERSDEVEEIPAEKFNELCEFTFKKKVTGFSPTAFGHS